MRRAAMRHAAMRHAAEDISKRVDKWLYVVLGNILS
jgi:hypothetical protein